MIIFRRLIRSKGSKAGHLIGGHRHAVSVKALIAHAKKTRHVYAFVDENGNEGTIRSGIIMRTVDSHVRNIMTVGDAIQRPLPFSVDNGQLPDPPSEIIIAA
jgi:hypothetical protein